MTLRPSGHERQCQFENSIRSQSSDLNKTYLLHKLYDEEKENWNYTARQCPVPFGKIVVGWRGPRSSRQEKRVGKERGRASETGEGSPLAGEDNWQKPLPKRRLPSTVISVQKLCFLYIFNPLLNKLSSHA